MALVGMRIIKVFRVRFEVNFSECPYAAPNRDDCEVAQYENEQAEKEIEHKP
jgi:hypothetical protein